MQHGTCACTPNTREYHASRVLNQLSLCFGSCNAWNIIASHCHVKQAWASLQVSALLALPTKTKTVHHSTPLPRLPNSPLHRASARTTRLGMLSVAVQGHLDEAHPTDQLLHCHSTKGYTIRAARSPQQVQPQAAAQSPPLHQLPEPSCDARGQASGRADLLWPGSHCAAAWGCWAAHRMLAALASRSTNGGLSTARFYLGGISCARAELCWCFLLLSNYKHTILYRTVCTLWVECWCTPPLRYLALLCSMGPRAQAATAPLYLHCAGLLFLESVLGVLTSHYTLYQH